MDPRTLMGAELELQYLPPSAVACLKPFLNFSTHDDGSIRSVTWSAGELAIYPLFDDGGEAVMCAGMRADSRIGLEVVTSPYPFSDWWDLAPRIGKLLGHIPDTPRTSIHLHVDMADEPWTYIRDVLSWVYALEAPLYRLSAGGDIHRGERVYRNDPNDHRYARPLSDPIGISWGRTNGPLVRWGDIENAQSASDFLAAWGRLDLFWNNSLPHYIPHRLHIINLASLVRLGTLEWRLFDGLYRHLDLFMRIVYAVHMLAKDGPPKFAAMSLGSEPDIDAAWLSNLLDVDISPLWGWHWPIGCSVHNRPSHYSELTSVPTYSSEPIRTISVAGERDSGKSNFVLVRR